MTSRTLNRLTLAASLAIFGAAIYVLLRNLEDVHFADILSRLEALPTIHVVSALLLMAGSYVVLTGYDFLALRYAGTPLRFRQYALASFIAFAFSHNIGLAMVSGGAVRYRIYSGLGLGAARIAEVVVFCAVTYALGIITVGGLTLSLDPGDVSSVLAMPAPAVRMMGGLLLAIGLAYLAASALWRRPIHIGRVRLRPPSFASGIMQIALASVDLALAGAVVYVLLPSDADVSYRTFLGIFVLAAAASVLSHVPGGLGVFETVIVVMLPDVPKVASMSAVVAYRAIYFLLPLALATLCMGLYEVKRGSRAFAWLSASARRTSTAPTPDGKSG